MKDKSMNRRLAMRPFAASPRFPSKAIQADQGVRTSIERNAMHLIWTERFHQWTTRTAMISAAVVMTALTAAGAQAFSLSDQFGRIPGLFGRQNSSKLAKPYAVLPESFYPTSVVWSPDGKYIADTGILTPLIHIWNVKTKKIVKELSLDAQSDGYHAMAWSPDGRYLAVCANTDQIMAGIWNVNTWKLVAKLPTQRTKEEGCQSPVFTPNDQYLAIATIHNVYVYSINNWHEVTRTSFNELPSGFGFDINEIAFQPNSSEIAIGVNGYFRGDPDTGYARVIFWNINTPSPDPTNGILAHSFIAYRTGALQSLAYNPSGTQLATGPNSGGGSTYTHNFVTASARIWDPMSYKLLAAPLDGHDRAGGINGLAFSADGRYLIAAHTGPKGEIDLIDAPSYKLADTLYVDHLIGAVAVNPRAPMFVATDNNKLMIWSIQ